MAGRNIGIIMISYTFLNFAHVCCCFVTLTFAVVSFCFQTNNDMSVIIDLLIIAPVPMFAIRHSLAKDK